MEIEKTLKALSDKARQNILLLLIEEGKLSAGEISSKLDMSAAALSYHLAQLKKSNLITDYKDKNFIFYEVNTTIFQELIIYFQKFLGGITNEKK